MKKRIIAILLTTFIMTTGTLGCTGTKTPASEVKPSESEQVIVASEIPSEMSVTEYLGRDFLQGQLSEGSKLLLKYGTDVIDFYSEQGKAESSKDFPETFDLRDQNIIPEVRSQNPWGTCWSFATIAACESSILSTQGLTVDSFQEEYGMELNLSEKHLAYFANTALPDKKLYEEGTYPYETDQAGEGAYSLLEGENGLYNCGGNYLESTSALAAGIGINTEEMFPYQNADGQIINSGDWSIPEENRFVSSFSLKNTNVLLSPALHDEDDNYIYNPAGTEAIKSELMKGRAIGIGYFADQSMPAPSTETVDVYVKGSMEEFPELNKEYVKMFLYYRNNIDAAQSKPYTDDELREMLKVRIRINGFPADTYDADSLNTDQLKLLLNTNDFGNRIEDISDMQVNTYLNFTGENNSVWAQYTYEIKHINHAVTIVGWDDHFSKDNFLADHKPPEDGAWIVRNSWGTDWGMDGYFYLSYYDQNISFPQSFEFLTEAELYAIDGEGEDDQTIVAPPYQYVFENDFMPAEMYNSTLFNMPVYTANIFDSEGDMDLYSVSALTGDLNAEVTVDVYRLKDGFQNPTDGEKVASACETFTYAGYHRILLKEQPHFNEGEKLSIVVKESVMTDEGEKFALVNTTAIGPNGVTQYRMFHKEECLDLSKYNYGIVNEGESFVSYEDGEWHDWAEEIASFKEDEFLSAVAFDNFPIKAYGFPGIEEQTGTE